MKIRRLLSSALPLSLLTMIATIAAPSHAQTTAARAKARASASPEAKRLDAKMEQVAELFMRDTATLITSYENIGQFDRARMLLEAVQKLDPDNAQVKVKLSEMNEKVLEANEFDFDITSDGSWQAVGAVEKGRPMRITIGGDYRLSMGLTASADGVPNGAPGEGLLPGMPLGAVVGAILSPEQVAAATNGKRNDKPPRTFLIGSKYERPADQDGVLYLKTNLPPGAKGTGRLKARISGPASDAAAR